MMHDGSLSRATKDYLLEGSYDADTWVELANGTFPDPGNNTQCNDEVLSIPIEEKSYR